MAIFLLIYLFVYGGMNFYGFWKVRQVLGKGWPASLALGLFFIVMVLGPILVRMLERGGWERLAFVVGLAAYLWMAVTLWFTFLMLAVDLWNLGARGLSMAWPAAARGRLAPGPALAGIGCIILLFGLYSLREAWSARLDTMILRSPHWAPGTPPLRILQISDVHLGLIERNRRLDQIMKAAAETRPDLIVSTGDLVDGTATHMNGLAERLAALNPPLGKYAIFGNHEYYVGLGPSLRFHEQAGFRVLRGEAARVNGSLLLVGVDDPAAHFRGRGAQPISEERLLPAADADGTETVILLKHRPAVTPAAVGRFLIQLSGHTHGGQVFPFGWLVRLQYPILKGFHELGQGSYLLISRGTGTWGPPLRLGSPPQMTLITIEPSEAEIKSSS